MILDFGLELGFSVLDNLNRTIVNIQKVYTLLGRCKIILIYIFIMYLCIILSIYI